MTDLGHVVPRPSSGPRGRSASPLATGSPRWSAAAPRRVLLATMAALALAILPSPANAQPPVPTEADLDRLCREVDAEHLDLRNGRLILTVPGGRFFLLLPGNTWCAEFLAPPHRRSLVNITPRWEQQQGRAQIPRERQHFFGLRAEPMVSLPEGGMQALRAQVARALESDAAAEDAPKPFADLLRRRALRFTLGPLERGGTCVSLRIEGDFRIPVPAPAGAPRRIAGTVLTCAAHADAGPAATILFAQEYHPADREAAARAASYAEMGRRILASLRFEPGVPGVWARHDFELGAHLSLAARAAATAWYRDRPRDPAGALRLWAALCEARGGAMLQPTPQRVALRDASVEVAGPGWCRIAEPGYLVLTDGWMSAEALADPANLTEAAARHRFILVVKALPPRTGSEDPRAWAIAERDLAIRAFTERGIAVSDAALIHEAEPGCVGFVLGVEGDAPGVGRLRHTSRHHLCREAGPRARVVMVSVDEYRLASDPGADARAAAAWAAIPEILRSIRFED